MLTKRRIYISISRSKGPVKFINFCFKNIFIEFFIFLESDSRNLFQDGFLKVFNNQKLGQIARDTKLWSQLFVYMLPTNVTFFSVFLVGKFNFGIKLLDSSSRNCFMHLSCKYLMRFRLKSTAMKVHFFSQWRIQSLPVWYAGIPVWAPKLGAKIKGELMQNNISRLIISST